jgi:hypothetical protein
MLFAVCTVPVSPMRATPSHKSEMLSQLIFGETCTIIELGSDQWLKIKCSYDGYEGWCQESQLTEISTEQYQLPVDKLSQEWASRIEYSGGPMMIPFGSPLIAYNKQINYTGECWKTTDAVITNASIQKIAFQFLNTAYLWGGRSVFGVDCSGFTQTVFRFFGISLLRDAWQQATQGDTVESLQQTRYGDLAFFDNPEGRITHVGILLQPGEIIHASGKVRIDKIDSGGIIKAGKGYTHKLRSIKRLF